MSRAEIAGIAIEYEVFGQNINPAIVLVMGLGVQMIAWPDEVCEELSSFGYFVVRFDNRDCGLSTKFEASGVPNLLAGFGGDSTTAPYLLTDMAKDTVGLLDWLNIDSAHIVGVSMGGMVAQQAVIDYPDRFRSLASIMSTTGAPEVGQPSGEAIAVLLQPTGGDYESALQRAVEISRVIGSPKYFNEDKVRDLASRSYERSFCPEGTSRQLMAILVSPERTEGLKKVRIPTLVVHGLFDKLVDSSGGTATSNAIPGSKLITFAEMGHDIPEQLWPEIRDAIVANVRLADAER